MHLRQNSYQYFTQMIVKRFYDILVKAQYTVYKDVWLMIKHQPYLIKMPVSTNKSYDYFRRLAYAKIIYHLELQVHQNLNKVAHANIITKIKVKQTIFIMKHSKRSYQERHVHKRLFSFLYLYRKLIFFEKK